MNLDEIIMRAIPISSRDCSINKAQKERMRRELKGRIEELVRDEREKALAERELKQVPHSENYNY